MRQCMDTLGATKRYDDFFVLLNEVSPRMLKRTIMTRLYKRDSKKYLFYYRSTKEVSLVSIMDSPFIMYNVHLMGIDTIRNTP